MSTEPSASLTGFSESVELGLSQTTATFSNLHATKPISGLVQTDGKRFSIKLMATGLTRREFGALMRELQRIAPLSYNPRSEPTHAPRARSAVPPGSSPRQPGQP